MKFSARICSTAILLFVLGSCYSTRQRDFPPPEEYDADKVMGVLMRDTSGVVNRIEFRQVQSMEMSDSVLFISGEIRSGSRLAGLPYLQGSVFHFPSDQVQGLLIREFSSGKTVATVVLVPMAVAAVVVLAVAASSCPIIYSWDGEAYHPDGEPLGGATTEGLARRDLTRLERIRPFQGRYRLAAVNEMEETQFVDAMSLVVVDHPEGSQVLPDREGGLHLVSDPVPARSAITHDGRDVLSLVRELDGQVFSYPMEESLGREGVAPRDSLVMEFERPAGVTEGRLVVRASTSSWGGIMLRQMLELWGEEIDSWYQLLDGSGATRAAQEAWAVREEHFVLKVWVEGRDGWAPRDVIVGNGPVVSETQVVPLDLSDVEGETVRIRVDPPRGFWDLDYVAMDFSADQDFTVLRVETMEARTDEGTDVRTTLLGRDSAYVEMGTTVGHRFTVDFPVPAGDPDRPERTVFASTAGYYRIHTDRDGERQGSVLDRLWLEPDYGVAFSFETYAAWRNGDALGAPGVIPLGGGR